MKQTEVITVLGQRGSGKSSWVKAWIQDRARFVLWDSQGEYEGYTQVNNREELFEELQQHHKWIFRLVFNSDTNSIEDFEFACEAAAAAEDLLFVVEEVDEFATPQRIPEPLARLLKRGRHWTVDMVFVSRRPPEIHRLVTSQSQRFVCFRILEPGDIRYLKGIIGSVADQLPDLEPLHFIEWSSKGIQRGYVSTPPESGYSIHYQGQAEKEIDRTVAFMQQ